MPRRLDQAVGTDAPETGRLVHELNELRRANAELEARLAELDALLEQRTRRASQLIGERDQLTARLAERDQRVQELTWQLGAASVRPAPLPAAPQWLARLWTRIAETPSRSGGREDAPPPTLPPEGARPREVPEPLVPFREAGPPAPIVAVVAFGLGGSDLEGVLDIVERHCAERGLRPLILTDDDRLSILRARRLIFEYLPPAERRRNHARQLDWDIYLQRRLALIRRKWCPVRVIPFGRHAGDMLALWAESPFEDVSFAELIGTRSAAEL